jgi:hypothetical protein
VNDFISKAIEKFKRDSNPRKQGSTDEFTYTDAVVFATPRFGDTTCVKNSPCDYVAAIEEMIEAGLRRFEFRVTTSKAAKGTPGSKRKFENQPQQNQSKKPKTGANRLHHKIKPRWKRIPQLMLLLMVANSQALPTNGATKKSPKTRRGKPSTSKGRVYSIKNVTLSLTIL